MKPLININWEKIIKLAEDHYKGLLNDEYDDDFSVYIAEELMTTIYGKDFYLEVSKEKSSLKNKLKNLIKELNREKYSNDVIKFIEEKMEEI